MAARRNSQAMTLFKSRNAAVVQAVLGNDVLNKYLALVQQLRAQLSFKNFPVAVFG